MPPLSVPRFFSGSGGTTTLAAGSSSGAASPVASGLAAAAACDADAVAAVAASCATRTVASSRGGDVHVHARVRRVAHMSKLAPSRRLQPSEQGSQLRLLTCAVTGVLRRWGHRSAERGADRRQLSRPACTHDDWVLLELLRRAARQAAITQLIQSACLCRLAGPAARQFPAPGRDVAHAHNAPQLASSMKQLHIHASGSASIGAVGRRVYSVVGVAPQHF